VSEGGRVTHRQRCATKIPELVQALEAVPAPRYVALEESTLADWLWRNLASHADEFIVCDPRRNHWIAKGGDKDDPLDAEKLAQLLRAVISRRSIMPSRWSGRSSSSTWLCTTIACASGCAVPTALGRCCGSTVSS
jgi:hypothetical protein